MNNQKGKINSLISPFWHEQMFFYFNQNGTAIAHSLLHPIIFFNNTLQTSFHVITLSSTLGYSDVTGYPRVFSNWGQSLYFISPFKNTSSPKRTSRHCIFHWRLCGPWRRELHCEPSSKHSQTPHLVLHSLYSLTLLFPQHSLSRTTTSPSGLLVYAM